MSDKSLSAQEKINNLVSLYKKNLYKEALIEAKSLAKQYPYISIIYNIYGIINIALSDFDQSLDCFYKALKLKPDYVEAHYNLGISLAHLGRVEEAILSYTKAIELKPDYTSAHDSLIRALAFCNPEKSNLNPCVIANRLLQNINYKYDSNKHISDDDVITFFQRCNNIILENINNLALDETEIFRSNTIDLNCERHFRIFNTFNVIPEYCFGCYKVQISTKNVIELFKLYFVFDQLQLPLNNSRKCLVELRPKISGTYKGLIYCFNLDEANKIFIILKNILKKTINDEIQIKIRRGCSEFAISYPDYKEINQNGDQLMKYKDKWREKEKIIDEKLLNETYRKKKKVVKDNLAGVTLSDVLIMYNWLNYAKAIGDNNYQIISKDILKSNYMENELSQQLDIRNKEFSSIH